MRCLTGCLGAEDLRKSSAHHGDYVSIRTTFASIKVGVPSSAGYRVDARTTFGSINSDIPMTVTERSDNSMAATVGSGTCRMTLTNSNGGITIERE